MSSAAKLSTKTISEGDHLQIAQSTTEPRTSATALPEPLMDHEIAPLAYLYWEARGRPTGSALEDWLRAEQDIQKIQTELPSLTNLVSQLERF
jgi:hypothetical protein